MKTQCVHDYEETFRKEYKASGINKIWYVEMCRKCGTHRGRRPGGKYHRLTHEEAQEKIIDHYEAQAGETVVDSLENME